MAKVKRDMPVAQRLIQALLMVGPSSYVRLAQVTGMSNVHVSDTLRHAMHKGQYGLYLYGTERNPERPGYRRNVVAIDIDEYNSYIRSINPRAKNAPRIPEQKIGVMPERQRIQTTPVKIPVTLYKTQWQPSSPYRASP